jgi:magnesium transporter
VVPASGPRRLDRPLRAQHRSAATGASSTPPALFGHRGAGKAHQHPKIEQYGEALFVVARTAQSIDGNIAFGETHLFVGPGYVVSVRHGASISYAAVRERCESCPAVLSHGEDYILYAILDFIVDNYTPVLETLHAEVDRGR